jgi:hypothetical protein
MIWLADTVYGLPAKDPTELLSATRFPDTAALEEHLLDGYLPAVYASEPHRGNVDSPTLRIYRLADAERWLRFLAQHLARRGSRDLIWWRLPDELSRLVRFVTGAGFGLIAAGFGGALLGRSSSIAFSAVLATIIGLPVGLTVGAAGAPSRPAQLRRSLAMSRREVVQRISIGAGAGLVAGLGTAFTMGPTFALILMALGVLLGLGLMAIGEPDLLRATSARSLLRSDAIVLLCLSILGLTIGALTGGSAITFNIRIPAWLAGGMSAFLAGGFVGGVTFRSPRAARSSLISIDAKSATGAACCGTVLGAIGSLAGLLASGPMVEDSSIVLAGAAFGLFLGLSAGLAVTSWLWYRLILVFLSCRRLLPGRLMDFLEDAHRRGVLRQVGAAYQFRHAQLQDRLTSL